MPGAGGVGAGTARWKPCPPASHLLPPQPSRVAGRPAAAQFVCRGLHAHIELPFFFLPSQFSSVPKFTPSVTSASAPPLLGTAFCLSGSLGSMGVCDDNTTRAYITRFISQALRRRSLMRPRAGVRLERLRGNPNPRRRGQQGGQWGSEAEPSRVPAPRRSGR